MSKSAQPQQQSIDLTTLPLPQLQAVRQQLDEEITHLTSSFTQLKQAQAKFSACIEALGAITPEHQGTHGLHSKRSWRLFLADRAILVPLTNSLYVPGKLNNTERVIVDVGTGYYVDKKVDDAKAFYKRKVEFLQGNLDTLQQTIIAKQNNMRVLVEVLQYKMMLARKEAAEQQAAQAGGAAGTVSA
ncbi:prefoldin, alpha subunit [Allomyces macrogynus ATCC 38327]|uniref:Prefoldin, alpha subunit n=1 Tax=Allomyces macrogynus (strain ATCC 38327) TaxID=578462 RepID=A0A0L0RYL9_ALLM3|nr:prefoldin, alpha subunit [Allomyces macrogynus ATCC 38327]|eukprot:KNE55176.1 prefoldin, alpha subunit [Allomyces macrogynus ATCC 38327]